MKLVTRIWQNAKFRVAVTNQLAATGFTLVPGNLTTYKVSRRRFFVLSKHQDASRDAGLELPHGWKQNSGVRNVSAKCCSS